MSHATLQCAAARRVIWALPLLILGLARAQTGAPQPASAPAMDAGTTKSATTYSVVNLASNRETLVRVPVINKFGQVAYTTSVSGFVNGFFYDGKANIFLLPGSATATNLNDKGQVVGSARFENTSGIHPFVWTVQAGSRDLLPLDDALFAEALDINNHGIAVGDSQVSPNGIDHAVRWAAPGRRKDLGSLGTGRSQAIAINDAGLIAGTSVISSTLTHAFAWTRGTGLIDIGTLGGNSSEARGVDELNEVAGNSLTRTNRQHVFLWTRATGIKDLGTGGGVESAMLFISSKGRIAGNIVTALGRQHAMTWTHATGMKDIGTLPGGLVSRAWGANNVGQVVGESLVSGQEPFHAFVWSAATGMVDLNKRVPHLPKGMLLQTALAISDNGSIVVQANTGLVVLKPGRRRCESAPPSGYPAGCD